MKFYDYAGIIHMHSSFSFDGHATMEQILSATRKTGIDFLMLTDHDHLQARREGWEGWQDKTLVVVGEEIAPRFNHFWPSRFRNRYLTTETRKERIPKNISMTSINREDSASSPIPTTRAPRCFT
jgi:histidinol phosphatase-like PHP family hydrolase